MDSVSLVKKAGVPIVHYSCSPSARSGTVGRRKVTDPS
jgi:hypothetical protein